MQPIHLLKIKDFIIATYQLHEHKTKRAPVKVFYILSLPVTFVFDYTRQWKQEAGKERAYTHSQRSRQGNEAATKIPVLHSQLPIGYVLDTLLSPDPKLSYVAFLIPNPEPLLLVPASGNLASICLDTQFLKKKKCLCLVLSPCLLSSISRT